MSCHHESDGVCSDQGEDGQGKEQDLDLGGCCRRRAHFWEGKACQKIELGSDSLGKVRAGKNQKWLKLGRIRLFWMHGVSRG